MGIHWQQRLESLDKALARLHEAVNGVAREPKNHLYQIALITAFQFTFQSAWKIIKDYLTYNGVDVSLPRDVIKQAFHHQLINDGQVWIEMLEERNLILRVYQEQAALVAGKNIRERYLAPLEQIHKDLLKKRNSI